jgi:hypothetical protein
MEQMTDSSKAQIKAWGNKMADDNQQLYFTSLEVTAPVIAKAKPLEKKEETDVAEILL